MLCKAFLSVSLLLRLPINDTSYHSGCYEGSPLENRAPWERMNIELRTTNSDSQLGQGQGKAAFVDERWVQEAEVRGPEQALGDPHCWAAWLEGADKSGGFGHRCLLPH